MKKIIYTVVMGAVLFGFISMANADTSATSSAVVTASTTVTVEDLGVSNTGTLPTSPLYFLKEWRRGIQRIFTFNPTAKAELELNITNEKAAEIIKVAETNPGNTKALEKAIANYTKSEDRLKTRLANIQTVGTQQNPADAKLFADVEMQNVKHLMLLNQVAKHFTSDPYAEDSARLNRPVSLDGIQSAAGTISGDPDIDVLRIAIEGAQNKVEDTSVVSAENDANIKQKATDQIARAEEAINQAETKIQAGLKTAGGMLEHGASVVGGLVPGGAVISAAVSSVSQLGGHTPGGGAASASYAKAGTLVVTGTPGGAVTQLQNLITKAKDHLEQAKRSYTGGRFALSFGQAQSAEMMAREVARMSTNMTIERQTPKRDFGDRVPPSIPIRGGTKDTLQTQIMPALPPNIPAPLRPVDGGGIKTSQGNMTTTIPPPPAMFCTEQYDPVCGVNGKTYSNACFAKISGIAIGHSGECATTQ
jgi:hypothetical protein